MSTRPYYVKNQVVRVSKDNFEAVARCFFYSVLTLRFWKPVRVEQENLPGTDVWIPVPKAYPTFDMHELRVRQFVDSYISALPEKGTITVMKVTTKKPSFFSLFTSSEVYEKWHLHFRRDIAIDPEDTSSQLHSVMQELVDNALLESHGGAEDSVEFMIEISKN